MSTTIIESPLSVVLIKASSNAAGLESDVAGRLHRALSRRGMALVGSHPIAIATPEELEPHRDALSPTSCGALFPLKFFIELHLHSEERMTKRLAWFAWTKAKELPKQRRLE